MKNKEIGNKYIEEFSEIMKVLSNTPKSIDNSPEFKSRLLLCGAVVEAIAKDKDINVCKVIREHVISQKKRLVR